MTLLDELTERVVERLLVTGLAFLLDVPVIEAYPAWWQWQGMAAGSLRNGRMLDQGRPSEVLAFPLPGSRGTWDMVDRALRAEVPVSIAGRATDG